jgi:amino acid transporter
VTTTQTSAALTDIGIQVSDKKRMKRDVNWLQVVFIAAGAPALVMFNLGALSAVVGTVAPLVWAISVVLGYIELYIYAEIAGLHPHKTGGTAVHGATAWVRYSKVVAPISIWSNWLGWSPVLAIGAGLASGYLLSVFVPADSPVNTWQITLLNLSFIQSDLTIRINAQFILGTVIMVAIWSVQHVGILRTARAAVLLTAGGLIPLLLVTILPIFMGRLDLTNFSPFVPLSGSWNFDGWRLVIGGLFLAAWSTYAAETAVCYMSEFKDPGKDGPKALIWSGVVCILLYVLTPFVFQAILGTKYMMSPDIVSGVGVGTALASMVNAGGFTAKFLVVILTFTLLLAILTAMAGSSRTLYEGGSGGWMPKYLDKLNDHGIPTRAMWTDLVFNALLLLMSDYVFVLAISAVNYILFHFLNLNAGWMHRIDNPRTRRPYKAPQWLFNIGFCLAYVDAFLIGAGANLWGPGVLFTGLISAFIAVPVFWYRHYFCDKGKFPQEMLSDLLPPGETELGPTKCGILPYLALAGGAVSMALGYIIFWTNLL